MCCFQCVFYALSVCSVCSLLVRVRVFSVCFLLVVYLLSMAVLCVFCVFSVYVLCGFCVFVWVACVLSVCVLYMFL